MAKSSSAKTRRRPAGKTSSAARSANKSSRGTGTGSGRTVGIVMSLLVLVAAAGGVYYATQNAAPVSVSPPNRSSEPAQTSPLETSTPPITTLPAEQPKPQSAAGRFPVALEGLMIHDWSYGLVEDPHKLHEPGERIGPRPWNNGWKIVERIDEDFEFADGEQYFSSREDVFVVEGDFATGVGLWARMRDMYHWIEYEIPEGAVRFTADLLVTDDPDNHPNEHTEHVNQQFNMRVFLDGEQVFDQFWTRFKLPTGSGATLTELDIPLPEEAKVIRFLIQQSNWGDGNANTELVLHKGVFHDS